MTENVGSGDRIFRALLGIVLIALPFATGLLGAGWPTYLSVIVGIVMLATAAMRFCPLYTLFGMSTCRR